MFGEEMNHRDTESTEGEEKDPLSAVVIEVHRALGPGLLESAGGGPL